MNRLILRAVGLAGIAAAAACGGKVLVDGPSAQGDGDFWIAYCDARSSACGIMKDTCLPEEACSRALLRDEAEGPLFQCLKTTCEQSQCVDQIRAQLGLTSKGDEYEAACKAYLTTCPDGDSDACSSIPILADDLIEQLIPCAAAPSCGEAQACFDAVRAAKTKSCDEWL